jgi:hypothetical protein
MRAGLATAALAAVAVLAAGCGSVASSGSSGGSTPAASAPAEQPLGAAWQLGGAYTGPVPPVTGLPDPHAGIKFRPVTDSRGYTEQLTVRVGPPLHYDIPQVLEDCYTAYTDLRSDLDPGMYVIPIQAITTNHTAQQAPAADPEISAEDADGNEVTVTDVLHMTLPDGACRMDVYAQMGQGGQTSLSGYIGPATASQLADAVLTINGSRFRLATIEPHRTASWLVAHS